MRIEQKSSHHDQQPKRAEQQKMTILTVSDVKEKEKALHPKEEHVTKSEQPGMQVRRGRRAEVVAIVGNGESPEEGPQSSDHSREESHDRNKPPAAGGGGGGGGGDNNGSGVVGGDDDPFKRIEDFANHNRSSELKRSELEKTAGLLRPEVREAIFAVDGGVSSTQSARISEIASLIERPSTDSEQVRNVFNALKVEVQQALINREEAISPILENLARLQEPEIHLLARLDHNVQQVFIDRHAEMERRLKNINARPEQREYTLKLKNEVQMLLFGGGERSMQEMGTFYSGVGALVLSHDQSHRDSFLLLPGHAQERLLYVCGSDRQAGLDAIGRVSAISSDQLGVYERMGKPVQVEIADDLVYMPEVAMQKLVTLGRLSNTEVEILNRHSEQLDIKLISSIGENPQRLQALDAIAADCIEQNIDYRTIIRNLHPSAQPMLLDIVGDASIAENVERVSTKLENIEAEFARNGNMFFDVPEKSQILLLEIADRRQNLQELLFSVERVKSDQRLMDTWSLLEEFTGYGWIQHKQFKETLQHLVDKPGRLTKLIDLEEPELMKALLKHDIEAQNTLFALSSGERRDHLQAIVGLSSQEQDRWYRQDTVYQQEYFENGSPETAVLRNYLRRIDPERDS